MSRMAAQADYVDASIMLSFQRGSSEKLVSIGFAGSRGDSELDIISAFS